jgi:heme A synthase
MKNLFRLALAADLVALLTVVLGSWTRIQGAGLTCPDWPLCRGAILPALGGGTIWEWMHRLAASAVAPLVLALVVVAWRKRDHAAFITPTLAVIAALFVGQILLGAQTVRLGNSPLSVVLHWATAMALIAALSAMAVFAAAWQAMPHPTGRNFPASGSLSIALGVTAAMAFATMCVGAYVSSSGAGLACLSLPGCAGNVVVSTPGQIVQMIHRLAAAVTLICAAAALALAWTHRCAPRIRIAVGLGVALVCVQVLLGLLNVALRLPMNLREAHAVNAALLFLVFFVATILAILESAPLKASRTLAEIGVHR